MRLPFARLGMCLLLLTFSGGLLPAQDTNPISSGNQLTRQLRAELNEKLNQPIEAKFDEVPLRDAVTTIADQIGADVIFQAQAIEENGLAIDHPVTLEINHTRLPARQVLDLILEPERLEAVNHNGILVVTSETAAEVMLYVRVYDVRDLVEEAVKSMEPLPLPECECREDEDDENTDEETESKEWTAESTISTGAHSGWGGYSRWSPDNCLEWFGGRRTMATMAITQVVQEMTPGPWFNIEGTGGSIVPNNGQLVVRQTDENHLEIQKILDGLRAKQDTRGFGEGEIDEEAAEEAREAAEEAREEEAEEEESDDSPPNPSPTY